MKISTLLEREPFVKIFEKTLSSFLAAWTGIPHTVEWLGADSFSESSKCHQTWYCNPLINSIFVKGVDQSVFESINGEYAHNPMKPWRSKIQRLYLVLSQSPLCSIVLSKYRLRVSPPVELATKKLIVGGNTKLRLIDVDNNKVYVLLKDGFDHKYMERELYVRTEFPYMPAPRIIDFGEKLSWYSEEYIVGQPPNRFEKSIGVKVLAQAVKSLHRMLGETKRSVGLIEYLDVLEAQIYIGMNKSSYLKAKTASEIENIVRSLKKFLKKYKRQDITLAHCHGDFHQGNILSNGENYWVLDWEYSGEKQIGYDLVILLLETRIESGFASRFIRLLEGKLDNSEMMLAQDWPGFSWTKESRLMHLMVFLLEDLIFHIEESANPLFYKKADLQDARFDEFGKIVAYLQTFN